MLKQKIKRVQSLLKQQKLAGLVVGNFGHQTADDLLYWLLLKKLELGLLYIPEHGTPTLYGISFEVNQLKKQYQGITIKPFNTKAETLLSEHIGTKTKKIGLRTAALPTAVYKKLQTVEHTVFEELQNENEFLFAQKLPEEIERMKKAATMTDELFSELTKNWKHFTTEADVAHFLNTQMATHGVEPSFPPIVATGAHAANPHHGFSDTKIQKGFCVIDMGVRYEGYCSDMTRTIFVGTPNKKEVELYQKLKTIQQAAVDMCMPGTTVKIIDHACREQLGPKLDKEFIHSLGHGLGTQVHEWPRVSASVDTKLMENMVITIEPGVYRAGKYGIRIEDDVLITKSGPVVLTQSSKDLITV